ncbi:hypothetical protein SAMN02745823_00327 [Sporobacter termitidis DSM 10068]|uniref:ATPase AAA-type core domain-containing protein n=1 Tax=Sporobacter termitidis DSM 10068 TaxID=1123282 RepID=A0A1M5U2K7_9FIRM|nr:ATP-binding protein [Sporobacter termitidis]SHH57086.1 hypothetical protein SAMN02745823_00327 [Sporobacter termitidis DSM 10068]
MLIQFSVENYLSIKDKVTFSMLAGADKKHPSHVIDTDDKKKCLKAAVLYGANASGKSNVLNAFWYMANFVLTSHEKQLNKQTGRIPFKLDRESIGKPSSFEVIFRQNGVRYAYGFSANEAEVTEEYLYYYPNGRAAIIFERKNKDDYRFITDVDIQNSLKERNSANKLYLSTAANWNYDKVIPVFQWFASCSIICRFSRAEAYGNDAGELKDDGYRAAIAAMLQAADLGIKSLEVNEYAGKRNNLLNKSFVNAYFNVDAIHQIADGDGNTASYSLNMTEESDGTNSYFALIGIVKKVLENGELFVVDDMDSHLHPLLTRNIVALFNSNEHNPKGAQLIFTSRNTNLLDLDIFRRDQIWFTEKSENTAATDLFSLYDFSVRKDTKLEKNYLLGRFGAIPFIEDGLL